MGRKSGQLRTAPLYSVRDGDAYVVIGSYGGADARPAWYHNLQTIIAEIGTDMSCFPTEKRFCDWLGLAPRNAISRGKVLHSHTAKVANRATQAFRMPAYAVSRSETAVGAYYRAMRAKKGPQQANVATAHKLAQIV